MNFYLYAVIASLITGLLGFSYGNHVGSVSTAASYDKRDNKALRDAQTELAAANKKVRDGETEKALALAATSKTYQEELRNVTIKKDKLIHDLRVGSVRLRDPGTKYSINPTGVPSTPASTGRCDDAPGRELSNELSEFLTAEASRADAIVKQLTACQKIVVTDRKGATP